ncbi:hypothetical protein ACFXEL_31715 [Streptomyces sp. NPDC059382]|uniref:hypothetical protein n=1 Tax=Streptomyces sp. NPDC059382 TaxID=3346816 RepID=UPI00367CFFEF
MSDSTPLPPGVRRLDRVEQEMVLLIAAGVGTAGLVEALDDLTAANVVSRIRKVADKLGSPTVVRSGLVYRSLCFRLVEEPTPIPRVSLPARELRILRGVAQGRPLTRIAEDLGMEDWDLNPLAIQMRKRLHAQDYAHAVRQGWRMQLLTTDSPGIPTGDTRSSSQITAAAWMRRPRPSRALGVQPTPASALPPAPDAAT